ncbi:hypothetical protein CAPTEDRAFT_216121 [Capitella teleta]|uniref:LicD/FKTN/FKRP nucleotidyltransferase domain-containing protein n=1 Tax=Capitella teleta TaxID=283909 RepID=R7TKL3_CAPTE|nr:hypothetical protein CAPTEDRAFT_216121 [Capitella teleta]|eukprot:ELT92091.1 hypothetical protein CAPTEDRAFT_216121 [Capitella teleta]
MQSHEKKKLLQTLGLCVFSFGIFAATWNLRGETSNVKFEAIDLHHRNDGAENSSNHMLSRPGKVKLNHNTSSIPHEFNRAMSRDEYQVIEDLLSVFHSAMTKNNLTYFIASGTLLGSYRHHGIIPWDDDVDVYILSDQKMRAMQALSSLGPQHALDAKTKRWKLFSVFSQPIQGHSWKFPFVDISLLDDHSDWLADSDPAFVPRFSFHKDWIFPLRLRPFGRKPNQSKIHTKETVPGLSSYTSYLRNTIMNNRFGLWQKSKNRHHIIAQEGSKKNNLGLHECDKHHL